MSVTSILFGKRTDAMKSDKIVLALPFGVIKNPLCRSDVVSKPSTTGAECFGPSIDVYDDPNTVPVDTNLGHLIDPDNHAFPLRNGRMVCRPRVNRKLAFAGLAFTSEGVAA